MELSLMELAEVLQTDTGGSLSPELSGLDVDINTDTRSLEKNQTYWALKGENFDGHDYTGNAFEQGCAACVVNRDWHRDHDESGGVYFPVQDTYQALLDLGRAYAGKFSFPKIAVTGSNGKTTAKEMLQKVLQKKGTVHSTRGNFNNHIGVPLTLFGLKGSQDFAVIEMGSNHPGEIAVLSETARPDFCIITSIGHSHREFFNTLDDVLQEKLSIVKGLAKGGSLLVNADDEYLAGIQPDENYDLSSIGIEKGDLRAENAGPGPGGCYSFSVQGTEYRLKVPGRHNVYNALFAIAVGTRYGVNPNDMADALEAFASPAHRMEIKEVAGLTLIDDTYNANPNSVISALKILASFKAGGRKIAALGEMGEIGEEGPELHRQVGRELSRLGIDECMSLGPGAREFLTGAEEAGFSGDALTHFDSADDMQSALQAALKQGDVVLIKGSRFLEMEKIVQFIGEAIKNEQ